MKEKGNEELACSQSFKFENLCQTVMDYGQEFFEWIAWQGYQTSGKGVILIHLNDSEANHLKVSTVSWKPMTSPDFAVIWEHSAIARPLLRKTFEAYRQLIETYDPISEYVVFLTTPTQLSCLKGLSLWERNRLLSISKAKAKPVKEFTVEWIETFNQQQIPIAVQTIP